MGYNHKPQTHKRLTGLSDRERGGGAEPRGRQRVIATMSVVRAAAAFFLDVDDLAVSGDFPVLAGDAAARECGEAEKANETHHGDPSEPPAKEQLLYR